MAKDKFTPDDQNIISFSLMGPESGGPCLVDSNDGKNHPDSPLSLR